MQPDHGSMWYYRRPGGGVEGFFNRLRCSSTFGLTLLWIVLPTPCAQPALICASLSLKDPESAPPSERSPPQDLHQAPPVVLVISVTAVTKIQRCPLEPTP